MNNLKAWKEAREIFKDIGSHSELFD